MSATWRSSWLPWLLIAFAPAFFGLLTWTNANPVDQLGQVIRLFGLPLYLLELGFMLVAVRAGWRPIEQVASQSSVVRALLAATVAIAFASAALAPNAVGSLVWTYLSLLQLLFGFAAAWLTSRVPTPMRNRIWPAIAGGCLVYAGLAAAFALSPHEPGFDWQYFGLAVANVRQVGFYMVVGTLAAVGCAMDARSTKAIMLTVAAVLMMTLSFWTGSRGAAIAAIAAIIAGCIAFPHLRSIRNASIALVPIPAGALLSSPLPRPMVVFGVDRMISSLKASTPDAISGFRLRMWEEAWQAFLHRPWIGYGEAQFGIVAPQPQAAYLHPHNIILQLLVQWGSIGAGFVAALAIIAGIRIRSALRTHDGGVVPAFLVCVGLLVFSFYDGAMFHTYPVMMFAFALAFLVASAPEARVAGVHS